ncbi:MAG: FtsQ-type POTRA domain-containing protein [Clostridia bacterium]|nr:FtsQ-type POTRA domain-containing protein [Clostridia bacterium]
MPKRVQTKKIKKKTTRKKKNKKALKKLILSIFVLFVIGLLVGVICLIYHVKTDEKFNISNISVTDCNYYTIDDIIAASELELGKNIYSFNKKEIQAKVQTLPYIESVKITRRLPNEVNLTVVERTTKYIAYAKDSGEYVKIDKSGYVLEIIDINEMQEEILLFGINFEDIVEAGHKITDLELEKLKLFEKVSELYNAQEVQAKITSVEFKSSNIILTLNDKLDVILKDNSELEYKLSFLKTILKEVEGKSGILDMTQENPTYSAI